MIKELFKLIKSGKCSDIRITNTGETIELEYRLIDRSGAYVEEYELETSEDYILDTWKLTEKVLEEINDYLEGKEIDEELKKMRNF